MHGVENLALVTNQSWKPWKQELQQVCQPSCKSASGLFLTKIYSDGTVHVLTWLDYTSGLASVRDYLIIYKGLNQSA